MRQEAVCSSIKVSMKNSSASIYTHKQGGRKQ